MSNGPQSVRPTTEDLPLRHPPDPHPSESVCMKNSLDLMLMKYTSASLQANFEKVDRFSVRNLTSGKILPVAPHSSWDGRCVDELSEYARSC